jgi:hypothetical protein
VTVGVHDGDKAIARTILRHLAEGEVNILLELAVVAGNGEAGHQNPPGRPVELT